MDRGNSAEDLWKSYSYVGSVLEDKQVRTWLQLMCCALVQCLVLISDQKDRLGTGVRKKTEQLGIDNNLIFKLRNTSKGTEVYIINRSFR
jgi:hypothetical protein